MVDLYGCDEALLNNGEELQKIAHAMIESIGAKVLEEHIRKFSPIGITYFAVISTSHFSIHTWPENGYAAVDLFSCGDFNEDEFVETLKQAFSATDEKTQLIERSEVLK